MLELERYHRQMLFRPIGEEGQKKLLNSHVLLLGAGALGTSSSEMLVRAGLGKLTIIDRDYVEISNMQRQHLYTEEDVRNQTPKAIAAKEHLQQINSSVTIEAKVMDAGPDELEPLLDDVDLIIDATDNFDTRFIINDLAIKYQKPWIYGACVASYGVSFVVLPGETPCLECLMEHLPQDGATCDTVGVISPVVQMVVSYQISEAIKLLTGNKDQLSGKLVAFDLWSNEHMSLSVNKLKKADCTTCGKHLYPNLSYDNRMKPAVLCGRNTVQIRPRKDKSTDLNRLKERLEQNEKLTVSENPFLVSFQADPYRIVIFRDGRALIHGTKDITEAKKVYNQYIGG